MKKKKIIYLLVSSLAITLTASLSSCANGEAKKWAYTKDEMSDFIEMDAIQTNNSDNTITFSADTNVEIFDENIDKDDVIVFDKDKVKEELEKSNKEYADYSTLKKASVEVVSTNTLKEKDGFDITFKGDQNANYGMLLYSKVTVVDKFTSVSRYEENKSFNKDPQSEFEETYASTKLTWEQGGKLFTSIFTNFATICLGINYGNPITVGSGIMGIVGSIFENCSNKDASIKDVINKLKEVDTKINQLSDKIDKNTQLLQEEIVRVNANVDKANLNILNISMNDFAVNAIAPINKFNRNMEDEIGNYYKDFISKSQTIKLVLEKNSEGVYYSIPLSEINDASKYNFQFEISDFTNAKTFLAANSNIVKNGFVGELEKDIENVLNKTTNLKSEIKKEDYIKFLSSRIIENFNKEYYSTHKDKAQEYRNLMIEYAESISGLNGKVNYLNTYLSRLEYMYNFQAEIKPLIRSFCVNLLKNLDANTALALQACYFAEYNSDELSKLYISTRDLIQKFYTINNEKNDAFSFITGTNLTGHFYKSKYDVDYTNLGNHPELHVNFSSYRVTFENNMFVDTKTTVNFAQGISESNHLMITTRWNLLKNIGATSSDIDYVHYLSSNNVISSSGVKAVEILISLKIYNLNAERILTNDRQERDLNSEDSISLMCVKKGNNNSHYFEVNERYIYRENRNPDCWAGKTFEGKFISATSGTSIGTQKICSWARYAEARWSWTTDEFFAFTADDPFNYYFLVENC